jgi:ActR/RegA family two-component response regulator
MTGYGQAADKLAAQQAGFDAHIVKPASADKIMRALYGKPDP